ncbi:MAG: hypothetical protein Q4B63_02240 [Clostridium perfringens]|nr:hypothetical protein [Clostridium perfringens]
MNQLILDNSLFNIKISFVSIVSSGILDKLSILEVFIIPNIGLANNLEKYLFKTKLASSFSNISQILLELENTLSGISSLVISTCTNSLSKSSSNQLTAKPPFLSEYS